MNRLGFLVLSVLLTNGADNRMAAMSLKEIMQTEDLDVKENTLFKKLRDYEIQEYVKAAVRGVDDGTAVTVKAVLARPETVSCLRGATLNGGLI